MKKLTITLAFLLTNFLVFAQWNYDKNGNSNHSGHGTVVGGKLTGDRNSFYGTGTGNKTTTGSKNTFVGAGTGAENTTGEKNTAIGAYAANKNTGGEKNTAIGAYAGYNSTNSSRNTFVGAYAANKNTVGASNTFLGASAGYENTTGSNNTFVGDYAGKTNLTGSGNVFLGNRAGYNEKGANKLYIANSNTAAPLIHGDFSAATLTVNGTLTVTGDASKAGGGSWSVASDQRLKKDIRPFTDGLETLQKISPVHFRYNGKANMPTEKEYVGIIAQEMQKIAPYTVNTFTHKDENGSQTKYLEYDSSALDYIMVNAIKAQQEIITAQQKELDIQKKEIAGLKEMVYGLVSASKKVPDSGTLHAGANGEE